MELLSPAGSFESLQAAIDNGANAVYFGVEQLNMRARASNNFTVEDIDEIAQRAKSKHVRTYLTLNTVMYDHDIQLAKLILQRAKDAGITAVIASDHAILHFAHKIGLPVHLSTQANCSNFETVLFYSAYCDAIVLARELSLRQVAEIVRQIRKEQVIGPSGKLIKIEIFGHGALCMAISGKCYLSLHSHNASANRGACIQNCRHTYTVKDKEEDIELEIDNEYIMSAKDLCTIDFLDQIVEAGVSILKIEGRGRSADYVATTATCYQQALKAIAENTYNAELVHQLKEKLSTVYNRGFWDGYYLGKKIGEWATTPGSIATRKKIYIGKGLKYFDRIQVAEFQMESGTLDVGDEILITGPSTGVIETTVTELRVADVDHISVKKGDLISFPLPQKIRLGDKLYKVLTTQ